MEVTLELEEAHEKGVVCHLKVIAPAPSLTSLAGSGPPPLRPLLLWLSQRPRARQRPCHNGVALALEAEEFAAALRLLSGGAPLFFKGKRLVCDLFTKVKLELVVSGDGAAPLLLRLLLAEGPQRTPFNACEALLPGTPPAYILRGVLRLLPGGLPWRLLTPFLRDEAVALDDTYDKWLRQLQSDDDPPVLLRWEGGAAAAFNAAAEPTPLLKLCDRCGAVANLYMVYPDGSELLYRRSAAPTGQQRRLLAVERQWESDLLETDYRYKPSGSSDYYCPMPCVAKSLTFLLEVGWRVRDHLGRAVYCPGAASDALDVDGDKLLLRATVSYGSWQKPLHEIVGSFNRRDSFIALGDGAVGLLPQQIGGADLSLLASEGSLVAEGVHLPRSKIGLLDLPALPAGQSTTVAAALGRLADGGWRQAAALTLEGFRGTLRPYQEEGLRWLRTLYDSGLSGLLADDMGLGKTVQILALFSSLPPQAGCPHLIVAPTSLLFNWRMEVERFLPGCRLLVHSGAARQRDGAALTAYDIVLTSYALLRQDQALLQGVAWHLIVADEAQTIKNAHTKSAQALCALTSVGRLAISGTPIENRMEELWSYFRFLLPDLLGEEKSFSALVAQSANDPRPWQAVRRKVRPFILRRSKGDVAQDLPEKEEQTVWVEMGEGQRRLYDDFIARSRSLLLEKVQRDGLAKHRMDILELLLRLRQLCCHPLLLGSLLPLAEEECASAKSERLLEDLLQIAAEGRKVLLYSQFTSFLTLIKQRLTQQGQPFLYLDGQTADREEVVGRFQSDPASAIFLISLKAGGVGLNLTAADYVLIADPWWNDAAEQQAIDRAHRIGRRAPVIARRYIVHGTVEEKIMRLKERKRALAQALLDDSADPLAALTFAELQTLLE